MPATPPSLVRLAARVTPETIGAATSSPISDQVPDERNAVHRSASGAPTTADAVSWEPGATTRAPARPVPAATSGRQRSEDRARLDDLGQEPGGDAQPFQQRARPVTGERVEHLAGACVRVLGDRAPAQEVGEEVAHHEQPVRRAELRVAGACHREQLVQRVDGHELDARGAVDLRAGNDREGLVDHARGPCVAIVDGVAQEAAARVEKAEVDAPGVHPDGGGRAVGSRRPEARGDVAEEAQEIPVERPVQHDRHVREPVDVVERQAPAVEGTDHDAAALRAQVDRDQAEGRVSQGGTPRRGAGGSRSPGRCTGRSAGPSRPASGR